MSRNPIEYASNDSIDILLWENQRAFTFQQFPLNYPMQLCNTTNGMPGTAINNQIVNNSNNNNSSAATNGSLVVDSIIKSTTNFSLNEDSNGIKDATKKSARDPQSHRIIEKRRRDRMNKCLNDLSKLIPQHYIKKGRGRIEKTEIVEMAIKYINYLRDNKGLSTPTFGGQLLDSSKMSNLSAFSSISMSHFKDESEQSNPSLQNSLQNSMNRQQFNESSDEYSNGFRDCFTEAINFLSTVTLQAVATSNDSKFNEQLIVDLRAYLDAILIKNQQDFNSLAASKRSKVLVDFSPKSTNSVDGLQIKLEEMDVEESSSRIKKQDKLNFEDKFINNIGNYRNFTSKSGTNTPINLSTSKCPPPTINHLNNTLKNYLTSNDPLKSGGFANLDQHLNSTNIKSRSLTSSPNSSNLDNSSYKFKSLIREKFDAEYNSKVCKSEHMSACASSAMSRPRSATVGANASSLRRLNTQPELKEKLNNSTAELHAPENRLQEHKTFEKPSSDSRLSASQQLPPSSMSSKSSLVRRSSPGFVLHPNQSYYIPVEIDLANLMTHLKPMKPMNASPFTSQEELLINLQNLQSLQSLATVTGNKSQQQLNLHQLHHLASLQNGSQTSLNQSFQDHLSYSSPSLNSLNSINNHSSGYLANAPLLPPTIKKCCALDDPKFSDQQDETVLYPISISVNFKFPPLPLNAILNSQKS